jgi:hypothetical protein
MQLYTTTIMCLIMVMSTAVQLSYDVMGSELLYLSMFHIIIKTSLDFSFILFLLLCITSIHSKY